MVQEQDNIIKTDTGIPIRNIWYMLLYVLKRWDLKDNWKSEVENAPSINYLLALILGEQIQQRMRIGLGKSYSKIENKIHGLRGRVDFNKSLK